MQSKSSSRLSSTSIGWGDHDFCPLLSHHVRNRFHHGIFLYDKSFSPRWFPTLWHAKIVSARYWNKSWYDTQPGRKGWSRSRPKQQPGQTYVSLVLSERLNSSDASPFDRGIRDGRRHFGSWHSPSTRAGAIPRIKARDSRIAASRSIVSGMSVVQTKIIRLDLPRCIGPPNAFPQDRDDLLSDRSSVDHPEMTDLTT